MENQTQMENEMAATILGLRLRLSRMEGVSRAKENGVETRKI